MATPDYEAGDYVVARPHESPYGNLIRAGAVYLCIYVGPILNIEPGEPPLCGDCGDYENEVRVSGVVLPDGLLMCPCLFRKHHGPETEVDRYREAGLPAPIRETVAHGGRRAGKTLKRSRENA